MDKKLQKGRERLADLSQRERDVLKLIALGLANDEIATRLFISPHTVKNHVSNIYRKLGIDDRTQVALVALRLGIVSLDHLDKA
jgi:two-component system response regulator DegU